MELSVSLPCKWTNGLLRPPTQDALGLGWGGVDREGDCRKLCHIGSEAGAVSTSGASACCVCVANALCYLRMTLGVIIWNQWTRAETSHLARKPYQAVCGTSSSEWRDGNRLSRGWYCCWERVEMHRAGKLIWYDMIQDHMIGETLTDANRHSWLDTSFPFF